MAAEQQPITDNNLSSKPPSLNGLNHIKLPCTSLRTTHSFYTKILGLKPLQHYNHYTPTHHLFGVMVLHSPSNTLLELRYSPTHAASQKGWDPITWGVQTRNDLEEWGRWFDEHGVKRSRVFVGVKGWVMGVEDPDGRVVRLYVEGEEHEWTHEPDRDEFWLGSVEADPAEVEGGGEWE